MRDLALLSVLALSVSACKGESSASPSGPNVLLITVDTLRADALGIYGAGLEASPAIDAFARGATVFERCQATSSWTLSSLASLMTGLPSATHRAYDMGDRVDTSLTTLAEELLVAGWDTAAVASHVFLGTDYGLHQGFVHYDDDLVHSVAASHAAITSPAVSDKGLRFLEQKAAAADGRPWLLWLHYFDPHDSYLAHAGVSERFGSADDHDLYRGEVAFTDQHIGRVFDALDSLGLADDTLVVFTADHGEEFGDHGGSKHGHTLYRELLRVPLILRVPGQSAGSNAELVSLIDLAPTVRELCGLPMSPGAPGRSLAPLLQGTALDARPVLAELRLDPDQPLDAWLDGAWKLVIDPESGAAQLFDIQSDPDELDDRAQAEPQRVASMTDALRQYRAEALRLGERYERGAARSVLLGEGERLGDLGYGDGALGQEESE